MPTTDLTHPHERWSRLARGTFGASQDRADAAFDVLVAAHDHPPRTYHNLTHVSECLVELDVLAEHPAIAPHVHAAELALWFHDAICTPAAKDNEARSAALVRLVAPGLGVPAAWIESIAGAILDTQTHDVARDELAAVVIDADIWIFAAEPAQYDAYRAQLRAEYAAYDDARFAAGRRRFIEKTLAKPHIYHTEAGRSRYETPARANMARELAELPTA